MKALIIEDEKAAVRNLMALLGQVYLDIEVIDVLDSITDSVEWFQSHPMPELIFLDIHFADWFGFRGVRSCRYLLPDHFHDSL